jgi:hypothetical protein
VTFLRKYLGSVAAEIKEFIRNSASLRPFRLARLRRIAKTNGHEDWGTTLDAHGAAWKAALAKAKGGPRVLIATSMGGHFALNAIDRLLSVALTLRDADVAIGLCDGLLPACQMCESNLFPRQHRFIEKGPQADLCSYCFEPAAAAYRAMGLSVRRYGEYVTDDERRAAADIATTTPVGDIPSYKWCDLPVGEHAFAGTLRFFARGDVNKEPLAEAVLRRYLEASILMAVAVERLLEDWRPDVAVVHHGIYVPQGIVAAAMRKHGVRLVTWNQAYRNQCFIFSHADTYHRTMMDEPVEVWAETPFDAAANDLTQEYLKSRWNGAQDWISFQPKAEFSLTEDLRRLGLDPLRPVVLALTNVFWDAQIHYPANAFASQREWLVETVRWFESRPALQLVIRVHPAELSGTPRSRQLAADVLREVFPILPKNVVLIGPDEPVSTYDLAKSCDSAIIFATKTGVELATMGIPTIVAGEAWIRNKGMTLDARTAEEYFSFLERLPMCERLSSEVRERAIRFAFHFFFRRMIPLSFIASYPGPRRFTMGVTDARKLMSGEDAGLDTICEGILRGSPFHMEDAIAIRTASAQFR